jgi:hypothetical protein
MYMQASMTENRLTGLALMHIHYAKTVDLGLFVEEQKCLEIDPYHRCSVYL